MVSSLHRGLVAYAATVLAAPTIAAPAQGLSVAGVTIAANGARSNDVSGDESTALCRHFRLTPAEVRTFFAAAGRVDDRAFHHDLSMSRCYAAGALRTTSGSKAQWFIDLERRGSLRFSDGRTLYVYCFACRSPKFDEVDDEDRAIAESFSRVPRRQR